MSELGYHITLRTIDDRPLAPSPAARRTLAGTLLQLGEAHGLFVFAAVDTHLHAGVVADRASAGRFCQRLGVALAARLEVPLEPARIRPFHDAWHRQNTFRYVLRQPEHHGVGTDPFREATLLPDLLRIRVAGAWAIPRVQELFPRLRRADLVELFGPLPDAGPLDPALLVDATLAASGLPRLDGSAASRAARTAALHAARAVVPTPEIARLLGVSERTLRRLSEPDPAFVRAIQAQAALRSGPTSVPLLEAVVQ